MFWRRKKARPQPPVVIAAEILITRALVEHDDWEYLLAAEVAEAHEHLRMMIQGHREIEAMTNLKKKRV
jgi:hypothetical protein